MTPLALLTLIQETLPPPPEPTSTPDIDTAQVVGVVIVSLGLIVILALSLRPFIVKKQRRPDPQPEPTPLPEEPAASTQPVSGPQRSIIPFPKTATPGAPEPDWKWENGTPAIEDRFHRVVGDRGRRRKLGDRQPSRAGHDLTSAALHRISGDTQPRHTARGGSVTPAPVVPLHERRADIVARGASWRRGNAVALEHEHEPLIIEQPPEPVADADELWWTGLEAATSPEPEVESQLPVEADAEELAGEPQSPLEAVAHEVAIEARSPAEVVEPGAAVERIEARPEVSTETALVGQIDLDAMAEQTEITAETGESMDSSEQATAEPVGEQVIVADADTELVAHDSILGDDLAEIADELNAQRDETEPFGPEQSNAGTAEIESFVAAASIADSDSYCENVDINTLAAISQTVRDLIYCANAGELLQGFALYSDPFLFRFMDGSGMDEDGFRDAYAAVKARPADQWDRLDRLSDVVRRPDGAIEATVTYVNAAGKPVDGAERFRFVFDRDRDFWAIDDIEPIEMGPV